MSSFTASFPGATFAQERYHHSSSPSSTPLRHPQLSYVSNVYALVAAALLITYVSSTISLQFMARYWVISMAPWAALLGFVCCLVLAMTPYGQAYQTRRIAAFTSYAALQGVALVPLIHHLIYIDPSIIQTTVLLIMLSVGAVAIAVRYQSNTMQQAVVSAMLLLTSVLSLSGLIYLFTGYSLLSHYQSVFTSLCLGYVYLMFDLQQIQYRAQHRPCPVGVSWSVCQQADMFMDALGVFQDVIMIAVRLAQLLASQQEQQQKKKRRSESQKEY